MQKTIILLWTTTCIVSSQAQEYFPQSITKNEMVVEWLHRGDRVHFQMEAPTQGWLAIGFNDHDHINQAYLVMGRVVNKKTEVVQYYTSRPGQYRPISQHGATPNVEDIFGEQNDKRTQIKFSLPIQAMSKFERSLLPGKDIFLILAFSREDDFQHHSTMRTSLKITL